MLRYTYLILQNKLYFFFTLLFEVLFTFPSRYWFTVGRQVYLALEGGPPSFARSFTRSVLLWNAKHNGGLLGAAYGTITLFREPSRLFGYRSLCNS